METISLTRLASEVGISRGIVNRWFLKGMLPDPVKEPGRISLRFPRCEAIEAAKRLADAYRTVHNGREV